MAATAISLQFRRRGRNTSILLFQNPSSLHLFSSSSSIPDPPNNSDDQTPSPPSQSQSQSQSQTSFSSYFSDLKSSLKQQQQQPQQQPAPPYQRQPAPPNQRPQFSFQQNPNRGPADTAAAPPNQRPQFSFQQNPNRGPATAGPTSTADIFGRIRKNLSEFRDRTAAPPPEGLNSPPPRPNQTVSFQELYRKNVMARNGSPNNTGSSSKGGQLSYGMIRESLKQMSQKKPVEENKGNDFSGGSKLTNSFFGAAKSTSVYGGTEALPSKVFGKESKRKDGEPGEMKTKFLKMYTYGDLGEKLKMLRPEEAKKNTGKWFSLKELSERLIKLREFDVKEVESRSSPLIAIRESLEKLSSQDEAKKKSSYYKIETLGQLGGTPNYMLSPPKENLVEKYFHPDNMSSAEKMKIELQKVRDEFKMSESDCGSSRVQVAQLTTKIKHLSTTLHKKDKHSRKGLQAMVQRRKKLLKYMRRTDWDSYCLVLDKLGLRDNPDYKN